MVPVLFRCWLGERKSTGSIGNASVGLAGHRSSCLESHFRVIDLIDNRPGLPVVRPEQINDLARGAGNGPRYLHAPRHDPLTPIHRTTLSSLFAKNQQKAAGIDDHESVLRKNQPTGGL